LWKWGR